MNSSSDLSDIKKILDDGADVNCRGDDPVSYQPLSNSMQYY